MRLNACVLAALLTAAPQGWIDPSPHSEGTVRAGSIRLHYLDWGGSGQDAIVFLTGMGVTPHIFDDLASRFLRYGRVLGPTRRGVGKSDRPATGYDTATLAEDLRHFLDAMGIQRATLIGWSLAGAEMTRFATAHPSRVDGLVYLDAAYDYAKFPELWSKDPLSAQPTAADLASLDASRRWFTRTFGFWSNAIEADARAINLQPDGTMKMEAMPEEITKQLMSGMTSARPDFARITAPVLAFFAVSDAHPFLKTATAPRLRQQAETYWNGIFLPHIRQQIGALMRALPNARIVELPDAQHLCFIRRQDVDRIVPEVMDFLGKRDGRRR